MSGKNMKLLRRFAKRTHLDEGQKHAAKAVFDRMNKKEKRKLRVEMIHFEHEQAQSIEGLAERVA